MLWRILSDFGRSCHHRQAQAVQAWILLGNELFSRLFVLAILRLFQAGLSSPVVVTRHHQARVIRKTINVSYDVTGSRLSKLYSLCYLGILLQRSLLQIANVFSRRKRIFFASYLDDFKRSLESKGQKVLFSLSISLLDLSFWERLLMPASCRCSWERQNGWKLPYLGGNFRINFQDLLLVCVCV